MELKKGRFVRTSKSTGTEFGAKIQHVAKLLPTPVASSLDGRGGKRKLTIVDGQPVNMSKSGKRYGIDLVQMAASNLLPTPDEKRQNDTLAHSIHGMIGEPGKTSQLNPLFVLEMMGFPPDWTSLPFLKESGPDNPPKPSDDGEPNP